ncbi:MAG: murein biosynthesis integral membrane protein MurJ [Lentisphaeria bacterium]|nr:murein biosynthesis integral membrane protein MurJ [Lentisphaeria bacterium]
MSTEKKSSIVSILKSSIGVSFATLASRVLGLLRVRLEAMVLGGGDIASGWFLAFAIPNLLRRVLGEGALGNALMPIVAELDSKEGRECVRRELGVVFFVLGAVLGSIVILVSVISLLLGRVEFFQNISFFSTPRMKIMLRLLPLLMPYGFFMCLVGAAGSVLNYCKEFVLPALGALLLNIFLISGLGVSYYLHVNDVEKVINILAYLVLISGFVQLVLMLLLLQKQKVHPMLKAGISLSSFTSGTVKLLFTTALPGIIGGVATQVSFLVDRMIAVYLGAQAVPALTYVDRLIDLPIGIFAVSLGGVLMSSLSRSAANGNMEDFSNELDLSIRHVFFFCIPMAVGVVFFFKLLMSVLCLGGRYTVQDIYAAEGVALYYGAGIPIFCLLKVLLPAFYSRKKMNITLYASLCAIVLNIVFNFILMKKMQQSGIALATVISSLVNCSILIFILIREGVLTKVAKPVVCGLRSLIIALASFWLVRLIYPSALEIENNWNTAFLHLVVAGVLFSLLYFGLSAVARASEMRELISMFKHKKA